MRRRSARDGSSAALVALALGLLVVAAACGKRGAPLPPLPRGPLAPRAVAARQIGDRVEVHATAPAARGSAARQTPSRLELLRDEYPPPGAPPVDSSAFVRRGRVVASVDLAGTREGTRVVLDDPTVASLADQGVGWTLRYAVRARDQAGRGSPIVVASDLLPLEPGAPPDGVQAVPVPEGVRVSWQTTDPSRTYAVYRFSPGTAPPERPLDREPVSGDEYLDTTVRTGDTYVYEVRPVLAAPPPWREGAPGRSGSIVARDTFPPAAPTGVVAVQEGQGVRVFWDPSSERDLGGYRVERQRPDGGWEPLASGSVTEPSAVDRDVAAGQSRRYRVIAFDRASPPNDSQPSEPVEIVVEAEPGTPAEP